MIDQGTELINLETNEVVMVELEDICGSCIEYSSKVKVEDNWYCLSDPTFWEKYSITNY